MANRILPAGRYWITVNHDDQFGTWQGWLDAMKDSVHVETTESVTDSDIPYEFYIFTTSKDLVWERGDQPTIAGPEIKARIDTVQRPDPEPDFTDKIHDTVLELEREAKSAAKILTWAVVIGLGIYAFSQLKHQTPRKAEREA
jgi:hypothetical protein